MITTVKYVTISDLNKNLKFYIVLFKYQGIDWVHLFKLAEQDEAFML